MKILLIEPFYSGSHKHFADQLKKHSCHDITLLTLPGKFWKWRMYGAAATLGKQFINMDLKPDLIMATDMLDLSVFLSVVRRHLDPRVPVIGYFHENQMAYPWQPDSKDLQHNRDLHYGMLNYQNILAADHTLFNSAYNRNSLFDELQAFFKKMPDHRHTDMVNELRDKSSVMPLGLELNPLLVDAPKTLDEITDHPSPNAAPLILWNHRWEHDKNPEEFFEALETLQQQKIPFRLAVLGESYKTMPSVFKEVPEGFKDQLIWYGYGSYEDYLSLLNHTDILPVTSNHDFFGISVMEAVHCGATPLLPKRLTYPDLYKLKDHPELFYDTQKDLIDKLSALCSNFQPGPRDRYHHLTAQYDWAEMINVYDEFFEKYV